MILEALSPMGSTFGAPTEMAEITMAEAQERSDIGAILVTAAGPGDQFAGTLSTALDCVLPLSHGVTAETGSLRALWLTPRSWIVLCGIGDESRLVAAVAGAFPDHAAHASRFTDALGWLTLEGAAVENMLRQGSFVSFDPSGLPAGHAKRTPVAGIPAVILRESEARWTIGVERSRARYFANWLAGLTHSFGEENQ